MLCSQTNSLPFPGDNQVKGQTSCPPASLCCCKCHSFDAPQGRPCRVSSQPESACDVLSVPSRRDSPVSQHVVDCCSPFELEALCKLIGLILGRISTAPHLLLPRVGLRIYRNQAADRCVSIGLHVSCRRRILLMKNKLTHPASWSNTAKPSSSFGWTPGHSALGDGPR